MPVGSHASSTLAAFTSFERTMPDGARAGLMRRLKAARAVAVAPNPDDITYRGLASASVGLADRGPLGSDLTSAPGCPMLARRERALSILAARLSGGSAAWQPSD